MSDFESILNEADDVETPVETTQPEVVDSTAAAESPALEETSTEAPAPVAEEAQPITRDDGAKWSEKAQRWYKDGVIVAGGKPDTTPEPSNPSTPQAPVVESVAEVPPPAPVAEPWTLRAAGQKLTVPGASIVDGKLVVEGPENIARHRDIYAAGIQHLQNYGKEKQQWTQQIKDAEQRGEATGKLYNRIAAELLDKINNDEWLQSLMENPAREREYLRRELALSLDRAKLTIPQAPVTQDIEITPERFGSALHSALDELIEDAPKGLLTPEDIAELKQTYARRMNAYAAEHEGEIVLDFHAVRDDFQRDLKMYTRAQAAAQKAAEDAKKAKAAAAFNAANTPKTPAPTPSRPAPKPALAAAPSGTKPSWDQSFKSAFADDEE